MLQYSAFSRLLSWKSFRFFTVTTLTWLIFCWLVIISVMGIERLGGPDLSWLIVVPFAIWVRLEWKLAAIRRPGITLAEALFSKWAVLLGRSVFFFGLFTGCLMLGLLSLVQIRFVPGIPWRAVLLVVPYGLWFFMSWSLTISANNYQESLPNNA